MGWKSYRLLLAAGCMLGVLAEPGRAATWRVTTTTDDNGACLPEDCSIREAALAANLSPEADLIEVPGGVHLISLPPTDEIDSGPIGAILVSGGAVEIRGLPGEKAILDGGGLATALWVYEAEARLVELEIRGARGLLGGGVHSAFGALHILRCTIAGNAAADGFGGGVRIVGGTARIEDSAIFGNTALRNGGGISFQSFDADDFLQLVNSTVGGNAALGAGGVNIQGPGRVEIIHSTIAGNSAETPGSSGLIGRPAASIVFTNSLIADECRFPLDPALAASGGGNLESPGATCFVPAEGDLVAVADPLLGPLSDNGGPTPTRALQYGSPALDRALASECAGFDQRGVSRPQAAGCDIGAFELAGPAFAEVPATGSIAAALLAVFLAAGGWWCLRGWRP